MRSAFGVEHTISKSFVPGEGYKAASKLGQVERHIVRNKAMGNRSAYRAGKTPEKTAPNEPRKIWSNVDSPKGKLKRVFPQVSRSQTGAGEGVQGFSRPNGRKGGDVIVHRDAVDPQTTYKHELAHIGPRRNPHTMQQRFKDPERLGREEGRADFRANAKPTTGQYPGDDKFQRGYNEVQGRMAAAKWKKENLGDRRSKR